MGSQTPTDRELDALKILWTRGKATVREIYEDLRAPDGSMAYTTILSLLQSMEHKGLVGHESAGKAYSYHARVEKDGVIRRMASGFLDRVFDGAIDQYVAGALQSRRPTVGELEKLERLIEQAKQNARGFNPGEAAT